MPLLAPSVLPPSPLTTNPSPLMESPTISSTATKALPAANIPLVTLNSDNISDVMVARLTTSLVQHVLYLKNQVPFPIAQLARLPSGRNARATKKKEELLDAIDTLTCHLLTTFTALSTALALNTSRYPDMRGKARADVAVVLGPAISGARARVLLCVDGLEVKVWGQRDYDKEEADADEEEDQSDDEDDDESNEEELAPSPTPSPVPSRASTPSSSQGENSSNLQIPSPPQRRRQPFSPRPSGVSQSEEAQILLAAERLLSYTLANACAEEGNNFGSEISPTQTHILIRAPRRFDHPSWIPRQSLSSGLENIHNEFLEDSGLISKSNATRKSRPKRSVGGVKTEGVWIRCKSSTTEFPLPVPHRLGEEEKENYDGMSSLDPKDKGVQAEAEKEEDEMIWWSWNGKIVGFSDW